jgi:hypothetical protein
MTDVQLIDFNYRTKNIEQDMKADIARLKYQMQKDINVAKGNDYRIKKIRDEYQDKIDSIKDDYKDKAKDVHEKVKAAEGSTKGLNIDKLIEEYRNETDPARRIALKHKIDVKRGLGVAGKVAGGIGIAAATTAGAVLGGPALAGAIGAGGAGLRALPDAIHQARHEHNYDPINNIDDAHKETHNGITIDTEAKRDRVNPEDARSAFGDDAVAASKGHQEYKSNGIPLSRLDAENTKHLLSPGQLDKQENARLAAIEAMKDKVRENGIHKYTPVEYKLRDQAHESFKNNTDEANRIAASRKYTDDLNTANVIKSLQRNGI